MRVLIVATEDWYVASHRLPVIAAATAAGMHVTVVTRVRDHRNDIEAAGADVVPINLSRGGRNPLREAEAIWALGRIYKDVRPDLVHHVGIKPILYGGWAARLAGVSRVVQAFAGLGTLYANPDQRKVQRWAFEAVARRVTKRKGTRVLVQNESDGITLVARGLANPDALDIIRGSGVDLTRFTVTPEPTGVPVVLMAARLLRDKGVYEFVEAARSLQGTARFVLVGAADEANPTSVEPTEVEGWVDEGIVESWGHRSDMPEVLSQANLVVLPSYREGLPKALLEAAAAGRAIVTTRVPGCWDVVTDNVTGLLVPAKDAASLAEAIAALLHDPERRKRMGASGRELVEAKFADTRVAAAHLELYSRMLG